MKTVFINNRKLKDYPDAFYIITDNSIDQLDTLFGFQTEPYSFNIDFGLEKGTILEYNEVDIELKRLFPKEYQKMSKCMTTEQLRELLY